MAEPMKSTCINNLLNIYSASERVLFGKKPCNEWCVSVKNQLFRTTKFYTKRLSFGTTSSHAETRSQLQLPRPNILTSTHRHIIATSALALTWTKLGQFFFGVGD